MDVQALPLHLYALGPPEVRLGENLVTFPTRKTLALLIYLAIESGAQPREHLAAMLWPDSGHLGGLYRRRHVGWTLCAHGVRALRTVGRMMDSALVVFQGLLRVSHA